MSGKVNIVFGFIYLSTTAVLGPVLLVPGKGEIGQIFNSTVQAVENIHEEVETSSSAEAQEKSTARAVVSIMDYLKAEKSLGFISSAAHAHGNLEALLNIAVGIVLLLLVIPANYKTLLSLLFILGAVLHSGMLYLAAVFGQAWAANLTLIGAIAIVAGLVLMGVASIVGIKQES
jgi:uncharacterized membrane protein YgdD (TMEM256/DUF423 family)